MPTLNRRELIGTLVAGAAWSVAGCRDAETRNANAAPSQPKPITLPNGTVDWRAVRELFPLSKDAMHLSTFLFVSQPKPVAEEVERYRKLIDADTVWIERAAFAESEGHPFSVMKRSLADYIGGAPDELCLTSNATQALAMAYHGLRIRQDQEILTTEHDHYSQHESIRFAAARSGCGVRYVSLYDDGAKANAAEMVSRLERAITPKTRAVGVTWVHSCTGVKLPIPPIAEAVARANRGRARCRPMPAHRGWHARLRESGRGRRENGRRLFRDKHAQVAVRSARHRIPLGPGRHVARIATDDPDVRSRSARDVGGLDEPTAPAADESQVRLAGRLSRVRERVRREGGGRASPIDRPRPDRGAHPRAQRAFRDGAAKISGVTLHTPLDPEVSGGISCYEVRGLKPDEVVERLNKKSIPGPRARRTGCRTREWARAS